MERLTFEGNFCDIAMCAEIPGSSFCEEGYCTQRKVWERLKVYEDTGLAPEEILTGKELAEIAIGLQQLNRIRSVFSDERMEELMQAEKEGRCVVLNMPRKPLVWGDDERNICLCPDCGKDLMGIPYGERRVLQCPECGQYLDATKIVTHKESQAALKEREARP